MTNSEVNEVRKGDGVHDDRCREWAARHDAVQEAGEAFAMVTRRAQVVRLSYKILGWHLPTACPAR